CVASLGCPGRGSFAPALSAENHVVVPSTNLGSHLYASASCTGFSGSECPAGTGDANGYAAVLYVYASDITLEQASGPSVTSVGGELASGSVVHGVSDVTFTASDPGSGVYQAVITVDGHVVQASVPNDNGGRCRNVGQSAD